jgi:hypothetical protein
MAKIAIQSFLLIVRTLHFVTGSTAAGSQGFSGFPAFGQIYRQQFPLLSHDVLNPARVPL